MAGPYYRYFLAGLMPVRIAYREKYRLPLQAEVPEFATGQLYIDNLYLNEIDFGDDIKEIDESAFQEALQNFAEQQK